MSPLKELTDWPWKGAKVRGGNDNMENRGTRKHVSGEEQKRTANYSSLTKPEGDKQQSSNPPLFRKPLGLCPPLCFFIVQNNTNNHLLQSSGFFSCLQLFSGHCLLQITIASGTKQMWREKKSYRETRGEEEIAKREQVKECSLSESDPKSTDIRPALPPAGISRGEGWKRQITTYSSRLCF